MVEADIKILQNIRHLVPVSTSLLCQAPIVLTTNPPISKLYDTPETPPSNPTDTLPFDEDLLGPYESNVRFEVFTLNRVY